MICRKCKSISGNFIVKKGKLNFLPWHTAIPQSSLWHGTSKLKLFQKEEDEYKKGGYSHDRYKRNGKKTKAVNIFEPHSRRNTIFEMDKLGNDLKHNYIYIPNKLLSNHSPLDLAIKWLSPMSNQTLILTSISNTDWIE